MDAVLGKAALLWLLHCCLHCAACIVLSCVPECILLLSCTLSPVVTLVLCSVESCSVLFSSVPCYNGCAVLHSAAKCHQPHLGFKL